MRLPAPRGTLTWTLDIEKSPAPVAPGWKETDNVIPSIDGNWILVFFWMCAFCCHQSDSKIIDHSKKPMKRYRIRVVWAFGLFLPFKKDIEGNQTWEYLHMIHVFLSSNGYQPISTDLDLLSKRRLLRWQVGRVSVVFLSCKFCTRRRFEGSNKLPFLT